MKLLFVLVPISFVIGLTLGFYLYIYLYFPVYLEAFTNIIPVTSISGLVGVIANLVMEWHKKLQLKIEGVFKENNVYFLQICKIRGEKSAEDCEGYLTTKDIQDYVSVWRFGSVRVRTISVREYLRLFELKNDELIFPSASTDKDFQDTNNPFAIKSVKMTDYINEKLTVTIGSKNGYKLVTTMPITDILSLKNPIKHRKDKCLNKLKICFNKK